VKVLEKGVLRRLATVGEDGLAVLCADCSTSARGDHPGSQNTRAERAPAENVDHEPARDSFEFDEQGERFPYRAVRCDSEGLPSGA